MGNEWRGTGVERKAEKEPNTKLRELAGRIKSLSYRDMEEFSRLVGSRIGKDGTTEALLSAADAMEAA